MNFENDAPELRSAHVIVVGNEKGGAGKSTISIHLAVALLKAGFKVACIDLDTRQQTMRRFFDNRRSWSESAAHSVELPCHCALERGDFQDTRANEAHEFAMFAQAIGDVEHAYEFVVIDTPASDSYLMRLAHSLADTLVSPINDSFIDIDVFSRVQHDRNGRGAISQYAELVREARRRRRLADNGLIDWVIVRNRVASLASHNSRQVAVSIGRLAQDLCFRTVEGFHDRVIFRELFPIGLTALDPIEAAATQGALTSSQQAARREIEGLIGSLDLPTRLPGVGHAQSRKLWYDRVAAYYTELANAAPAHA
jgi:chromosome partitioning protein